VNLESNAEFELEPKIDVGLVRRPDRIRQGSTLKPIEYESRTPISTRIRSSPPTVNLIRVRFLKSRLAGNRVYNIGEIGEIDDSLVTSDRPDRKGLLELAVIELLSEPWTPPPVEAPDDLSDTDGPTVRIKTTSDIPSLMLKRGVTTKLAERVAVLMSHDGVCDILEPVSRRGEKFRRKLQSNPNAEY
jgi:hypothetical protein